MKISSNTKAFLIGSSVSLLILTSAIGGALADRLFVIKPLDAITKRNSGFLQQITQQNSTSDTKPFIYSDQESAVIAVSEQSSKSVVTVSIKQQKPIFENYSPFGNSFFQIPRNTGKTEEIKQDIGTGFVVGDGGIIVTNKHVVSDTAEYLVIDNDNNEYAVEKIYRDPVNDIAIVKIAANLPKLELGDSDQLKVGQSVIAIGTALGEFRHTVTTGVISGLGRGITAGDNFGYSTEKLDNVIQTDAAINPGNSGGPLLNSNGQVIGVNVAVAGSAENIGFSIPINLIKESLNNFNETGSFDRPLLGVRYQVIPQKTAIMNDLPQGIYLVQVIDGSSAQDAGLQEGDVITTFDGKDLGDEQSELATLINKKKIGDQVDVEYWRDGEKKTVKVTLKGEPKTE